GPTTNTVINKIIAKTIFVFDKYLIPLLSPDHAEKRNKIVTMAIIINCDPKLMFMPNKWDKPPLICTAPNPNDVATPKTVANTAKTSIKTPHGPFIFSPNNGVNVAETSPGSSLRNWKKASANAMIPYIAQTCNPQGK